MRNLFRKTLVCAALMALQLAIPLKNLHAGPVWDWLLGRPILTYPAQPAVVASPAPVLAPASAVATVGYPTTVRYGVTDATSFPLTTRYAPTAAPAYAAPAYAAPAYAAPITANYAAAPVAGCNTCPAPAATTCCLPAVAVQAPPYSTPTVVGYAPAYRSSWYRVPVTYYRPVTAYTGVAAQPVTVMQPCNTQTYQVQRAPFLFHRPWLPATTATPYKAAYAPVVTQPAYPTTGAACCPNAATVAPSLNTPYYAPSTAMPATTYPSVATPSTVTTPQTSSAHIPSSSDTTPEASSSTPADQAPALQQIESAQPVDPNSASTSQPGATSSASSRRISPNSGNSVYQVKPIPDPEATQRSSEPRVIAPPLLNPRERTASSQPVTKSTAVTRAVYKTSVPAPAAAKPAPAKQQLWNDAGWQSAGR